jgi:hypothetical protein
MIDEHNNPDNNPDNQPFNRPFNNPANQSVSQPAVNKPANQPKEPQSAQDARKAAHDKVGKPEAKTPENKDRHAAIDTQTKAIAEQHRLIDEAPVVAQYQNPPHGYPRVEVMVPQEAHRHQPK